MISYFETDDQNHESSQAYNFTVCRNIRKRHVSQNVNAFTVLGFRTRTRVTVFSLTRKIQNEIRMKNTRDNMCGGCRVHDDYLNKIASFY